MEVYFFHIYLSLYLCLVFGSWREEGQPPRHTAKSITLTDRASRIFSWPTLSFKFFNSKQNKWNCKGIWHDIRWIKLKHTYLTPFWVRVAYYWACLGTLLGPNFDWCDFLHMRHWQLQQIWDSASSQHPHSFDNNDSLKRLDSF